MDEAEIQKVLESMSLQNRQCIEELRSANLFKDSYASIFFYNRPDLFEYVCRIILNGRNLCISNFSVQHKIYLCLKHYVCFDLFGINFDGTLIDVEIQSQQPHS